MKLISKKPFLAHWEGLVLQFTFSSSLLADNRRLLLKFNFQLPVCACVLHMLNNITTSIMNILFIFKVMIYNYCDDKPEAKSCNLQGYHHFSNALAQVNPLPNAARQIRSPSFTSPFSHASHKAIGTEAAVVLP